MNFNNIDEATYLEGSGLRPLARQSSVYSLTFDEIQNTLGGIGKDLGSMNMDELLKSIWNAEETQSSAAAPAGRSGGTAAGVNLLRQDSFTLPRTLSQKTVDEVWRGLTKDGRSGTGGFSAPQGQQTLGEMTLEEFLARAGVVKEDIPRTGMTNDSGFFGVQGSNTGLSLGFQQINGNGNLMSTNNSTMNHQACAVSSTSVKSSVSQLSQQHPIFPKQTTVSFAPQLNLMNSSQIPNPGANGSMVHAKNPTMNDNMAQPGGLHSGAVVTAGLQSPSSQVPLDMVTKNNVEDSSLFPVPYAFSQGRKSGTAFEKVVERRQKRMIKNRESAARSRARKQAYTLELEAEIAKLKEINGELERKQAQMMEMQKNEILEKLNHRPGGGKRLCLRRTLTGPW